MPNGVPALLRAREQIKHPRPLSAANGWRGQLGAPGGRPPHASAHAAYGAVMAGQLFPLPGFGSVHTIRPWIDGVMGVFAVT